MVDVCRYPRGPWHSGMQLAEALRGRGVACRFVMLDSPAADRTARAFGRSVVTTVVGAGTGVRRDLALAAAVRREIRAGVHVVHANTLSASRAAALGAGWRTPLVVHLRNSAASPAERRMTRMLSTRPRTGFIAVSGLARRVVIAPDDRVWTIPNPIKPPEHSAAPLQRAELSVGVVTSQNPIKGFDRLVEIATVARDLPVRFEVFGVTPDALRDRDSHAGRCYHAVVRRGLLSSMSFHGASASLHGNYAQFDVCLVVSRRESFGRVAAEAMRAGVPLVIPAIPGLLETTHGGTVCWTYDPDEPSDAAAKLAWIVNHRDQARDRAVAAERFSRRYDPDAIAARVRSVYASLAYVPRGRRGTPAQSSLEHTEQRA